MKKYVKILFAMFVLTIMCTSVASAGFFDFLSGDAIREVSDKDREVTTGQEKSGRESIEESRQGFFGNLFGKRSPTAIAGQKTGLWTQFKSRLGFGESVRVRPDDISGEENYLLIVFPRSYQEEIDWQQIHDFYSQDIASVEKIATGSVKEYSGNVISSVNGLLAVTLVNGDTIFILDYSKLRQTDMAYAESFFDFMTDQTEIYIAGGGPLTEEEILIDPDNHIDPEVGGGIFIDPSIGADLFIGGITAGDMVNGLGTGMFFDLSNIGMHSNYDTNTITGESFDNDGVTGTILYRTEYGYDEEGNWGVQSEPDTVTFDTSTKNSESGVSGDTYEVNDDGSLGEKISDSDKDDNGKDDWKEEGKNPVSEDDDDDEDDEEDEDEEICSHCPKDDDDTGSGSILNNFLWNYLNYMEGYISMGDISSYVTVTSGVEGVTLTSSQLQSVMNNIGTGMNVNDAVNNVVGAGVSGQFTTGTINNAFSDLGSDVGQGMTVTQFSNQLENNLGLQGDLDGDGIRNQMDMDMDLNNDGIVNDADMALLNEVNTNVNNFIAQNAEHRSQMVVDVDSII